MSNASDVHDALPLKPAMFHILLVLHDGEQHGYAIVQAIERAWDRRLEPANLYRTLRTMRDRGLIEASERRPDPALDDSRRRYFRLTSLGRRAAKAEARRLESLVDAARARRLLDQQGSTP